MIPPKQKFRVRQVLILIPLIALAVVLATAIFRGNPQKEEQANVPVIRDASAKLRVRNSPDALAAAIAEHQADFRHWSKARPTSAQDTPETQASHIAAGVALATARRPLMERLIREDPEQAIAEALTFSEWAALPPEIQALVERPFSIVANFSFRPVCAPPGAVFDPAAPEYVAVLSTSDGASLETFVYGARRSIMSKKQLPSQGIALGSLAAMRADALQMLAPADVPVARQLFDTTQADSGRSFATGEALGGAPVHAVAAGRLLVFSSEEEIADANERLAQADSKPGLVAASSYVMRLGAGAIEWNELEAFASAQAVDWTTTKKKVFLIRVNFSDKPADPLSQIAASSMLNGTVSENIRDQSYGKTWIEATVSANLYTMPRTSGTYLPGGIPQSELLRDARNTFRNNKSGADAAINMGPVSTTGTGGDAGLGDYDIVGITFGEIGFPFAGAAGGTDLWMQNNNAPNVYIHEFGHNYGLGHANSWDTTDGTVVGAGVSTEYGDIFDLMGKQPVLEGHFHVQAKQKLKWLSAAQWQDATSLGSNTYRVYRIDDRYTADTNNRGVRVTKAAAPAEYYWLSYRPLFEDNINQKMGVYLNWQRPGEDKCWLLDTTPNSTAGKKDSPITLGRTYSDPIANAHLTAIATGGTDADKWVDVRVNLGPFPGNAAPVASPIAGPSTLPARSSATYTGVSSDADSDTLAWHWDTKDGSVNNNSNSLTQTWVVGGTYSLDLTVSDMKGGKDTETKTVTVTDPLDTWTPQTSGSTGYLRASVWGKSRFVVAELFGSILTSWDGVTWTNNGDLPDFDREPRLAYGNGMFVAMGKKNGVSAAQICYSTDARTWNVATFPAGAPVPSGVTYADNRFLAVGSGGSVLSSTDGITWTLSIVPGTPNFRNVAWNGAVWMATMPVPDPQGGFSKAGVWTSVDGTTWSQQVNELDFDVSSVTSYAGVFYAAGWYGGITYSADNGLTWREALTPGSTRWSTNQIVVADDGTMLVGAKAMEESGQPQALLVSINGTQWFRSLAGTSFGADIRSLTFGFGRFVATGDTGSIRTSGSFYPDNTAPTASITTAPTSAPAREIRDFVGSASDAENDTLSYFWDFGLPGLIIGAPSTVKSFDFGGNYVATFRVSDGRGGLTTLTRNVTVSDPARTFTQRTSGTTNNLHAIAANADLTVAVGGNGGVIRTSQDGITWTTQTVSGFSGNIIFRGAVWDGSQFVIVGQDYNFTAPEGWQGCIYTSPDGATWTRRFGGDIQRNNELYAVSAGGGGLIAVGRGGTILESTNGTTWNRVTVPALSTTIIEGVAFGGGTWIITGVFVENSTGKVFTSTNRTTWLDKTANAGINASQQDMRDIAYLNNRFVGSGWYSKVRISTDLGESFTPTRTDHELMPGLAYGANIYFAAGIHLDASNADVDLLSLDGSTWTRSTAPTTADRNGAVFFKNTFITVGAAGNIWQSAVVTESPPNNPPTLTSVSPATGSTSGGTNVTLTGSNLIGATSVSFGGAAATNLNVINATTITCTTPARSSGTASVLVTTPGGTNAVNTLFTYVAPTSAPTLASVSPNSGSTAGGTSVTLTGTHFNGATSVSFGGTAATNLAVVNATTLTCTTPARSAGTASVLVTTPGGANPVNALFTYVTPTPAPSLTSISPATGNTAGGTNVTLTGTNFTGATSVSFGGTNAPNFTVVNATTITCATPARTAGTASVLVTTPGGTNAANTLFTYVAPTSAPTLASVSPNSGSTAGGTSVTLTGTNFTGATSVTFGGTAAISFNVVNATTISCTTPARSAGTASVLVTTPGGTTAANTFFTYSNLEATPPFLHLPLDGNTLDVSGHGRHGTASGGLTYAPGVHGTAAVFNGNQVIDFDAFSMNAANYTITGFFATTATGSDKAIFSLGSTIAGLQLSNVPTAGNLRFIDRPGDGNAGGISVYSPKAYHGGGFYHFAIRKSGSTSSIFVNGVQVASGNGSAGTFNGITDFVIGQNSPLSPTRRFVGSLDEIRVYATALSDSEIASLAAWPELFQVTAFSYDPTARLVDLTFTSLAGVSYTIETSTNLQAQSWTPLPGGPVPGNAGTTTITGLALPLPVTDKLFLRVRRDLP